MTNFISSILTGSQVYGNPTENSDIDLVVLVSRQDAKKLLKLSGMETKKDYGGDIECSVRFGKLNVICVTDVDIFNAWTEGTKQLEEEAFANAEYNGSGWTYPPNRNRAVEVFQGKFTEVRESKRYKGRKVVMT